ncbi:galactonate dehydratase [Ereboglobus sp. PH5-10]|uniref:galactonate dehydratase n=1 Tax=Ereboglobus sp. PH5-10 TaxID=2940629 RepID=UPI0024065309|nr:galactonate dehydratase [Ereboglobus sp. PH5-10]MDF9827551.1 galactonate dehydratase [Ereboglobus sp. PH5-10]
MKVTAIETHICNAWRTNWVFVRVLTDDGIHGVGEATLEYREQTVAQACKELERYLVGRDPFDIEAFWHDTYRDVYWRGGPVLMSALSAVEMALWDIKGKALGVPVWQLLGGRVRDRVPCYANGWFAPAVRPDEFAEKARVAVAQGFRGLKWDPFGSAYMNIGKRELNDAMACVQAVVEAVGPDVDILIEGHGRFNVPTAIRIAQRLEEFDITWFEEPVPPDNLDALAEVKQRVRVPIAAGERLYSRWDFRALLQRGAADYVQPDVSHAGGIGELRKIAAMAETHHIAICPHNPSGPVANAATLQLAACTTNFFLLETMSNDVPHRREISTEQARFEAGALLIPDGPGLGIDLRIDEIAKHPYEPRNLRHYTGALTQIRPPDAVSYFNPETSNTPKKQQ